MEITGCPALSSAAIALSRSEEHTSELQSQSNLVCRLLLEKKNRHCQSLHHHPRPSLGLSGQLDDVAMLRKSVCCQIHASRPIVSMNDRKESLMAIHRLLVT